MLVLSRKAGELLSIGPDITIEVVAVEGDRVRLGINAPRDTRIFRKELLDQTVDINKIAVNAPAINFQEK
ncbi:MAG TPA: carbon storage regulator [Feifaniaceae bacterium]|nr:carbon storage regulator [Feifaniaceae bacterium]